MRKICLNLPYVNFELLSCYLGKKWGNKQNEDESVVANEYLHGTVENPTMSSPFWGAGLFNLSSNLKNHKKVQANL